MATNVVLDTTMVSQYAFFNVDLTELLQGSITLELYNNHAPKVRKLLATASKSPHFSALPRPSR